MTNTLHKLALPSRGLLILICFLCIGKYSHANDAGHIVDIQNIGHRNWQMESFSLDKKVDLHIHARGAETQWKELMYAYAWILDVQSRDVVWEMDLDDTSGKKRRGDMMYEGTITLPEGDYEVYFAVSTFIKDIKIEGLGKFLDGIFQGLQEMTYSKDWGITIDVVEGKDKKYVHEYEPPPRDKSVIIQMIEMGDDAFQKDGVTLKAPATLRIYAIGEGSRSELEMCDYAWIMDTRTRERIWEMTPRNTDHAGGADKNLLFDGHIDLPAGSYMVYYVTDGSHSHERWNAHPPYDPVHWGITLSVDDPDVTLQEVVPFAESGEKRPVIEIIRMRDDEFESDGFTLPRSADLHIYALGEYASGTFCDYALVLDARTREKVWSLTPYNTRHAGGGKKNRLHDGAVHLPQGDYIVYYITDDSHSYGNWNAGPPYDPEAWGITIWLADDGIESKDVKAYSEREDPNILIRLTGLGNREQRSKHFHLEKTTKIRIYAIGEGDRDDMYDYAWIEGENGRVVWEMTYRNTEHAGGAKKNRLFNDTILLDKGTYEVHVVTDGSHSFDNWNNSPPHDPFHWGVTVMREE